MRVLHLMIKVIKTFVRRNFLQNVYKVSEKSKTAEGRILIKNFLRLSAAGRLNSRINNYATQLYAFI